MESLEATLIVAALFVARIALPLTVTFLFGLFMNYLVHRGWIED